MPWAGNDAKRWHQVVPDEHRNFKPCSVIRQTKRASSALRWPEGVKPEMHAPLSPTRFNPGLRGQSYGKWGNYSTRRLQIPQEDERHSNTDKPLQQIPPGILPGLSVLTVDGRNRYLSPYSPLWLWWRRLDLTGMQKFNREHCNASLSQPPNN